MCRAGEGIKVRSKGCEEVEKELGRERVCRGGEGIKVRSKGCEEVEIEST